MKIFRTLRNFMALIFVSILAIGSLCWAPCSLAAELKEIQASQIEVLANKEVPELLKTLEELVAIESGSTDLEGLAKIQAAIGKKLDGLGMPYQLIQGSGNTKTGAMILVKIKGNGTAKIALIAHMDTVYQKGDSKKQPFKVADGKAYGLGIQDDRAGIAVILHTLKMIKTAGINSFGELTVLLMLMKKLARPDLKKLLWH